MPMLNITNAGSAGFHNLSDIKPLLEIKALSLKFGGIMALNAISLSVIQGQIQAIIGPNGAGKTSLFNCLSGVYHPTAGDIFFEGISLRHQKPHQIAKRGMARTFQNIELFGQMNVIDNLLLGRHHRFHTGPLSAAVFWGKALREEINHRQRVEEIIDFLEIERYRKQQVAALPYGVQKRVELGRALAMDPKVLLLDEPSAGMNVEETEDIARFILDIKEEMGVTILMVEHDMGVVMDLSDWITVLNFGSKIAEGPPAEIQRNPEVIEAYLGKED